MGELRVGPYKGCQSRWGFFSCAGRYYTCSKTTTIIRVPGGGVTGSVTVVDCHLLQKWQEQIGNTVGIL